MRKSFQSTRRNPLLSPEYRDQLLHALEIAHLYLVLPEFFELSRRLRIDSRQKYFVGLCFIGAASEYFMRRRFKVGFGRRYRFCFFPEAFRLNGQQAPHFQEDRILFHGDRPAQRQPDLPTQSDTLVLPNEALGRSLMPGAHIARIPACETMAAPAGWAIFMSPARDAV
jgi:hypothetical protein